MPAKRNIPRKNPPASGVPIFGLLLGGFGFLILAVSLAVFFVMKLRHQDDPPPVHIVEIPPPQPPVLPPPIPVPPPVQPADSETWWDKGSILKAIVLQLQSDFPQDKALFENLGNKSDIRRWDAYRSLAMKLPEFVRNDQAKRQVARLLIECYAADPAEKNLLPLRDWFIGQIPSENTAYSLAFKAGDIDRTLWALDVSLETLTHKGIPLERARNLAQDLSKVFGFDIDPSVSRPELKGRAEKLLALRCYGNLLPTAAKSIDQALTIRALLIAKVSHQLSPSFREKVDITLAFDGLSKAKASWPMYSSLLSDCLKNDDVAIDLGVVELYSQADAELADKMQPVLASKWKLVNDEKLDQSAKVKALRRALGAPDPTDRLTQLEKLSRETLANMKAPAHQGLAVLQETMRLSHASTMACALLQKEIGLGRFDYLIANVPELDITEPKQPDPKDNVAKKTPANPKGDPPAGKDVVVKGGPKVFGDQLVPGVVSKIHQIGLRRGKTYSIDMNSGFDNYLRLQNSKGQQLAQDDDSGGGLNARIMFSPAYDDTYRIVATSFGNRGVGPYTVTVQEAAGFGGPGFGPGFGPPPGFPGFFPGKRPPFFPFGPPRMFPGPQPPPTVTVIPGKNPEKAKTTEPAATAPLVDETDLTNLATNVAKTRSTALQNMATKLKGEWTEKDLTMRQAGKVAKYLVAVDKAELEEAVPNVPPFAKSRNFMIALADSIDADKALQKTCEAVVGALLEQKLQFGKDENWRYGCRKLLLLQAVELTAGKKNAVTEAADYMRDYYKEQALLLGVPAADLAPLTRPSQVMECLIKHVAAKVAKGNPAKDDKTRLDQVPRELLAAKFVVQNDLEHTALLQRVWIKVLAMYLQQANPERAKEMRNVPTELSEQDPTSVNILEQLRGGEAKILRLWGLALDFK